MTTRFISQTYTTICFLWLSFVTIGINSCKPKNEDPPISKDSLQQVNLYFETSASMGGYLIGNTEFKNVITDLVGKSSQIAPKKLMIYTISSVPEKYTGGPEGFMKGLATVPLATGRSSELHTIFQQVGQASKEKGNISILISDCILSFPDKDIKQNPNINVQNAESVLKSQVNGVFHQLKQDTISAIVYAYSSAYNGTYYDFQNNKVSLASGEKRPYYIWIIGKQSLLAQFNEKLLDKLTHKPIHLVNFGGGDPINTFGLFYILNRKGNWDSSTGYEIGKLEDVNPNEPAEFSIGVDLSSLPYYSQQENHLKKNLQINAGPTASVTLVSIQRKDAVDKSSLDNGDLKTLGNVTHVFTFRVNQLPDLEAKLTIKLPIKFDTWYIQQSTMDDRTLDGRSGKTFAFQHLMNGVQEAYMEGTKSGTSRELLDLTIKLNQ